jgi:hypothetical protein
VRSETDKVRSISAEEVRSLKKATEAAYALGGGVSVITLRSRASVSQLSKYASTNEENGETLAPSDVVLEIDRAAGSPVITAALARLQGFKLVPDQAFTTARRTLTEGDALDFMSEAMDVVEAIRAMKRKDHPNSADKKAVAKEVNEAIRELKEILLSLGEG